MNDKSHLLRFGYAPGNYWFVCSDCGDKQAVGDKRAIRCETCAESLHAQITSVEAVADKHRAMTTLPEEAVKSADIIQVITDLRLAILQDDDEGLAEHAEPMVKAKELIAKLSASPFLPMQGAVKKLEWKTERADKMNGVDTERNGFHEFGYYSITGKSSGCFVSTFDNMGRVRHVDPRGFGSIDAAKAAAQADFEARILSALEPSAARELALEEAAQIAFDISENGEYHGEASVDSTSSIYQQGAFEVYEAIRTLSSPDHADAGKVEEDGIERTEFNRGYVLACANIVNLHGADVAVMEGFAQLGISKAELQALDLCEYDQKAIDTLEDFFGADKLYRTSAPASECAE